MVKKTSDVCPSEPGLYRAQVELKFPPQMYKENGGYYTTKDRCYVDSCIAEEIRHLWSHGVVTTGCCCGHGGVGMINTIPSSVQKMLELGYKLMDVPEGFCKETFIPKSKHISKMVRRSGYRG